MILYLVINQIVSSIKAKSSAFNDVWYQHYDNASAHSSILSRSPV